MTTEWQPWLLLALSLSTGVTGWWLREMWDSMKKMRADLEALREKIADTYIRRESLMDILRPVQDQLNRIEGALTHKVDKP
jgi:septal ring factor EnvC (AmiA/AmiB activator)